MDFLIAFVNFLCIRKQYLLTIYNILVYIVKDIYSKLNLANTFGGPIFARIPRMKKLKIDDHLNLD